MMGKPLRQGRLARAADRSGGPSHLELFDNKPQLAKFDGKLPPADLLEGYRAAFINPDARLLGPKFKFARHGQSGIELSELLPRLAGLVDELAVIKGMSTDAFNHAPGQILMSTGAMIFGRPSMGAWVCYGLGSESQHLPGFDHTKLTYRFQGRDFRLTDVHGQVMKGLLSKSRNDRRRSRLVDAPPAKRSNRRPTVPTRLC